MGTPELLEVLRPALDDLLTRSTDPELLAAVRRLRDEEPDDEGERFYAELRLVLLALMRLDLDGRRS